MSKALPLAAILLLAVSGCKGKENATTETATPGQKGSPNAKPALTKLEIKDTKVGTGPAVANGDLLFMRYSGKLANGTEFDSTAKHGDTPFSFTLGQGNVIKGWDQGLVGMKVGGKRTLGIPSDLGYGATGSPPTIPPNSTLYFDVELVDAVKKGEETIIDRKTLKPGAGPAVKNGDTVTFNYVGKLAGGSVFDEKFKTKPYTFKVGDPKVREFFQVGIRGTKKGGQYLLRVPPDAGFGDFGGPNIEGKQVLYYTIDIRNVK